MGLLLGEGQNCRGGPEGGRWGEEGAGRRSRLVAGRKGEGWPRMRGVSAPEGGPCTANKPKVRREIGSCAEVGTQYSDPRPYCNNHTRGEKGWGACRREWARSKSHSIDRVRRLDLSRQSRLTQVR